MTNNNIDHLKGRYYHTLSKKELRLLYDMDISFDKLVSTFKQPSWCNYPKALNGLYGCWSLFIPERVSRISHNYCKECDNYKPN